MVDFLELYLEYNKETEPPYTYHRWCALSALAAILGRNIHFPHGHFKIYPNLYTVLVGEPGSRKSTAIRIARKTVVAAGYNNIAADRTSKEKFLLDLQGAEEDLSAAGPHRGSYDRATEKNLWGPGEGDDTSPREVFITADELNEFIGTSNIDFCRMLGQLWDYEGTYRSRIKNGVSVAIPEPTITILGGITPQDYALTFPPELIGQGFLSRIIHIRGEKSDRQFHIPPTPPKEITEAVQKLLAEIQSKVRGIATVTPEADALLNEIYRGWKDIPDVRFRHYSTRRYTQLIKACLLCAGSRISTVITPEVIVRANTFLSAAEINMPKALGEFGKGKHSAVADQIIRMVQEATLPVSFKDIFREVHKNLDKPAELAIIIQGLEQAEKIHQVRGLTGQGWLQVAQKTRILKYVDWSILTEEEQVALR